jgi:hypothetical protein
MGAYPYLNSYSGPTWYITEGGNDTTATGSSGDPFRSIQAGINFSSHADSVAVAAGTYVENVNFRGRNIKVVGADRETTIIDGNQSGSVVTFANGEDETALLSGFTIQNGSAAYGGGIHCADNSNPNLNNLIVRDNVCNSGGGGAGVYCNDSSPTIEGVIIRDNASQDVGGGLYCKKQFQSYIDRCVN